MHIEHAMHGTVIRLACEEAAAPWAPLLLGALEGLPASSFRDGCRVQMGFSLFGLQAEEGGFRVLTQDYEGRPLEAWTDDLTIALWVMVEQGVLVRKCGVQRKTLRFDDEVIVADGALDAPDVSLQHYLDAGDGQPGWVMEALAEDEDGELAEVPASGYTALQAWQLLQQRPGLIQLLALPLGYMAVFHEDRLVCLIDPDDEEVDLN